ncbi:hypothetical protein [Halobellus rarus]|uniref:Uncharacterized protein n=1 Tax=Halobellus rarus TaxID=1126237 RepID=A0ABD6CLA7_9EURY|nr:hypothetical protein [Halobellus rarus]
MSDFICYRPREGTVAADVGDALADAGATTVDVAGAARGSPNLGVHT